MRTDPGDFRAGILRGPRAHGAQPAGLSRLPREDRRGFPRRREARAGQAAGPPRRAQGAPRHGRHGHQPQRRRGPARGARQPLGPHRAVQRHYDPHRRRLQLHHAGYGARQPAAAVAHPPAGRRPPAAGLHAVVLRAHCTRVAGSGGHAVPARDRGGPLHAEQAAQRAAARVPVTPVVPAAAAAAAVGRPLLSGLGLLDTVQHQGESAGALQVAQGGLEPPHLLRRQDVAATLAQQQRQPRAQQHGRVAARVGHGIPHVLHDPFVLGPVRVVGLLKPQQGPRQYAEAPRDEEEDAHEEDARFVDGVIRTAGLLPGRAVLGLALLEPPEALVGAEQVPAGRV
mmetsp:Transcript_8792/g.30022  ORF Transcript_8792/g.30022 Transcript_8792/m.30022 type:complete len:341 (+) Transcript_8792:328-1350(+)